MVGLIQSVIAISFLATITAMSINYIPVDAMIAAKANNLTEQGFKKLEDGAIRYIESITDANGTAKLPSVGADLRFILEPAFVFLPPAPSNMEWLMFSAMYGSYPAIAICLRPIGPIDSAQAQGVQNAKNRFSSAAIFTGETCGTSAVNGTGTHVTYWVVAQHYQ